MTLTPASDPATTPGGIAAGDATAARDEDAGTVRPALTVFFGSGAFGVPILELLLTDRSVKVVGVAANDTVLNARVTYYAKATVHETTALGTVTAGDQVGSGVTGDATAGVRTIAAPALSGTPTAAQINAELAHARAAIGVALTTATGPAKVRWMSY